jgi:hypothetical protein
VAGDPGPIRAGADAPRGESADLARMTLPAARGPVPVPGGPVPTGGGQGPGPAPGPLPELNDGYDAALFGSTDRPAEPVTSGMPFGAGPAYAPLPTEDSRTFMLRVANDLSANPELASYVARIRSGA